MFNALNLKLFNFLLIKAEICDIETKVNIMGIEQVLIKPKKLECGGSGCAEVYTESSFHKSSSKTCMSLLKLDLQAAAVVNLTKCNSTYETKFLVPQTNSFESLNVTLKCSRPPNFVAPNGIIDSYFRPLKLFFLLFYPKSNIL